MINFDPISYDKAEKAEKHSKNVQNQLNQVIDDLAQHKLDYIDLIGINDYAVTHKKRTALGEIGFLVVGTSANLPNLDLVNKTLTIYATSWVYHRKQRYTISVDTVIPLSPNISNQLLLFNIKTQEFSFVAGASIPTYLTTEDHIVLMAISFTSSTLNVIKDSWQTFKYSVNGEIGLRTKDIADGAITRAKRTVSGEAAFLTPGSTSPFPNFDLNNQTLTIYATSYLYYRNKRYTVSEDVILPFPAGSSAILYFNTKTETFHLVAGSSVSLISEDSILLATIFFTSTTKHTIKTINSVFPYYVNGNPPGSVDQSEMVRKADFIPVALRDNEYYVSPPMESVSSSSGNNLKSKTHLEIYAEWDNLMVEYPEFITKTTAGVDDWGNTIYRYDVSAPEVEDITYSTLKPKILWVCSVHGSEKTPSWIALQSIKQMLENWDSHAGLENLLWNNHFVVLPIANPTGWDDHTRKNRNGVDINRNMPSGWLQSTEDSSVYGGPNPLSEKEAQIIYDIINNEENLKLVIDFHNFFVPTFDEGFIWTPSSSKFLINLGKHLVSKLSREWKKRFEFLPQDNTTYFGSSTSGTRNGTIGIQTTSIGIYGGTFEVCEKFNLEPSAEANSGLVITLGVEAFLNWNQLVMKNLAKIN